MHLGVALDLDVGQAPQSDRELKLCTRRTLHCFCNGLQQLPNFLVHFVRGTFADHKLWEPEGSEPRCLSRHPYYNITGYMRGCVGIMEKKMETTI